MQRIDEIPNAARLVLLRGERGAGRDLCAAVLHGLSARAGEPLVRLDTTAVAAARMEAELFGEMRDGVIRRGQLEHAGAGTLVIDDLAALPMSAQSRLLRALDERHMWRNGSHEAVPMRARVVGVTAVDLERALARRTLREDLYFRLQAVTIAVPALRDRPRDVRPLAEHFLAALADVHRRPKPSLGDAAVHALQRYWWPGNVRELRDVIERAVLTCAAPEILPEDLAPHLREPAPSDNTHRPSLEEVERAYIAEVLEFTRGKKTKAATILGISRKTLLEKRKRYGLE